MMTNPFKSVLLGILRNYVEIATEVFLEQAKFCKAADDLEQRRQWCMQHALIFTMKYRNSISDKT